jgi:hypothetical protein
MLIIFIYFFLNTFDIATNFYYRTSTETDGSKYNFVYCIVFFFHSHPLKYFKKNWELKSNVLSLFLYSFMCYVS